MAESDLNASGIIAKAFQVPKLPGMLGTFMGRDALSLILSSLKLNSDDTVLLPAFTCQEVLRAFASRVNITFYDVCPDLSIDADVIKAHLSKRKTAMVLITDYFGFLQPYRLKIRDLCDENGCILVEDCAHSLLTEGAGAVGDFATFSLRKLLPVPDGGGLRINRQEVKLSPDFHPSFYSNVLSLSAIVKSGLNIRTAKLSRARVTSQTKKVVPITADGNKGRTLPLSYFTRRGLTGISFDEVAKKRRGDFQFWTEFCLNNSSLVPLFRDLPQGVCPFGFPVMVEKRAAIEDSARKAGILLSVHWRLDGTLGPECLVSQELSKRILTLPLFPDLRPDKQKVLAEILSLNGRRV